jgi:surface carbohydrate biosynthesis protein
MHLILPIETKVRELHSKLYLAYEACRAGATVTTGEARAIRERLHVLPRGSFFLDKAVAPNRAELFQTYRALGMRVAAWCEEGLSLVDPDAYLRHRIHPDALALTEMFFTWGPYQEDLIRNRYPDLSSRLCSSGNPRIDLLRPPLRHRFETEAEKVAEEFPRLLLMNTNYSLANHMKGPDAFITLLKKGGKISTPEEESFAREWAEHKKKLFNAFLELVPVLSRQFPDYAVVVRPHPSENHETYRKAFMPYPGVHVRHEGNVIPWLLASDVLIHNGCTTGVEAALLDRNVLAYCPYRSEQYDIHFPNEISVQCDTSEDVISEIRRMTKSESSQYNRESLQHYLHDIDGNGARKVVKALQAAASQKPSVCVPDRLRIPIRRWITGMTRTYVDASKDPYSSQKFDVLSAAEVNGILDEYRQCMGDTFRIQVEELWENGFRLSSQN